MSDLPPGIWWTIANSVMYAEGASSPDVGRLAARVHQAIMDEREACAKIADDAEPPEYQYDRSTDGRRQACRDIAAAIRASD